MKKTYEFENLGCAHCAGKMEEKIGKLPDVESVNLSFPMKKMYVETSREDLLPEIQKICTDIEPDVIVTEVTKKSSKRRKHVEEDSHESHEHHHHHEHGEYQDAHARAHANDIKRRFDGREVTNWQILLFGLTGGLIPCPAAITVLLICIQLKALTLGTTLVVSFSLGLALTLVTVGVGAAISVQQVAKRWSGFNTLAKRAPYFSSLLIGLVGVYMGVHGFMGIMR